MRRYLPDAAVDLVYLDPPCNSNRDDNVIFRDESGNATNTARHEGRVAYEDTWVLSGRPSAELGHLVADVYLGADASYDRQVVE